MKIPFGGIVSPRLLRKLYKDKVFYCVRENIDGKFYSKPCILSDCEWGRDFPVVSFFSEKMELNEKSDTGVGTYWDDLYDSFEEGKAEARRRNDLYFKGFAYQPYLRLETLEEHKEQLIYIEKEINKYLSEFENFNGIDFCDVFAGGIQIRGHHKQIEGYAYGSHTIKYDFSNIDKVISEFVDLWKRKDNSRAMAEMKDFISWGEKHGWD